MHLGTRIFHDLAISMRELIAKCCLGANSPGSLPLTCLRFVVANEIDHLDKEGFAGYPCIKALTRDIHRYQREKGHRKVPLIYSNKD